GQVHCRWHERGSPREYDCASIPPEGQPAELPPSGKLAPMDVSLLVALHACGQVARRQDQGHAGMTRLQLCGRTGQIAGTDGRQLLLWGGFAFPFADDVLIPAVPFFGSRELVKEVDVRLSRTAKHLVVAVGSWTAWLTMDTTARFPNVNSALPHDPPVV